MADQYWFRDVSGDANPIHVDADWAASNFPGQVVVHGVHAALWAIEASLPERVPPGIERLSTTFVRPILLGDSVRIATQEDGAVLRLFVEDELMMLVRLGFGAGQPMRKSAGGRAVVAGLPVERMLSSMKGLAGSIDAAANAEGLATAFPRTACAVGDAMLCGLARLSALVGMECPGLRSMFSEFSVTAADDVREDAIGYRVKRVNMVFSRVEIAVEGGGLRGDVVGYAGRAPVEATDAELETLVSATAFLGAQPLVLGGSSGLGMTAAKLLAMGGATPVITYRKSANAAAEVRDSIVARGGKCDLLKFDVSDVDAGLEQLRKLGWTGTQIYFFATPRIFRRHLGHYSAADLDVFVEAYVDRFHDVVMGLRALRPGGGLTFFYPSTVAVTELVPDLLEYGMAKQAGERLCQSLAQRYPELRFVVARLPRIETRQTQSFVTQGALSPQDAILGWIEKVQGDARSEEVKIDEAEAPA